MDDDFNGRYILDEQGNPMPCSDLIEWAEWFERSALQRRLARDKVGDYLISTVFLGLDHSFGSGPTNDPLHYRPMLWETMVFNIVGGGQEMWRYRSKEAALRGHVRAVERVTQETQLQESQLKAMLVGSDPALAEIRGLDPGLVMQDISPAEDQRESPEGQASGDEIESRRIRGPEGSQRETHEGEC